MKHGRRRPFDTSVSISDLFAGLAIALLLILVVLWLQALSDADDVRRVRKMAKIFDDAFKSLGKSDEDITVDLKRGEIILKAEQLFETGRWEFKPTLESKHVFVRTRTKIAAVLDDIEQGFNKSEVAGSSNPRDYVEIHIIGHTDCRTFFFQFKDRKLADNWDLSVLRAAQIARFLTEPCDQADKHLCCDGGGQTCAPSDKTRRLDPGWRVLPAGRGPFEPRLSAAEKKRYGDRLERCPKEEEELLQRQRRVVIQIVPRIDKFVVREAMANTETSGTDQRLDK